MLAQASETSTDWVFAERAPFRGKCDGYPVLLFTAARSGGADTSIGSALRGGGASGAGGR